MQGGPLMHVIAAKAVALRRGAAARLPRLRRPDHRQRPHAGPRTDGSVGFRLVSGGTDNHLLLVDVTSRGLTGKVAEKSLDAAGITVNNNRIPFDTRPPLDPSGIRIGTPALTTRGMREPEMRQIAALDRRGARQPRRYGGADARAAAGAGVVPAVPGAGERGVDGTRPGQSQSRHAANGPRANIRPSERRPGQTHFTKP